MSNKSNSYFCSVPLQSKVRWYLIGATPPSCKWLPQAQIWLSVRPLLLVQSNDQIVQKIINLPTSFNEILFCQPSNRVRGTRLRNIPWTFIMCSISIYEHWSTNLFMKTTHHSPHLQHKYDDHHGFYRLPSAPRPSCCATVITWHHTEKQRQRWWSRWSYLWWSRWLYLWWWQWR